MEARLLHDQATCVQTQQPQALTRTQTAHMHRFYASNPTPECSIFDATPCRFLTPSQWLRPPLTFIRLPSLILAASRCCLAPPLAAWPASCSSRSARTLVLRRCTILLLLTRPCCARCRCSCLALAGPAGAAAPSGLACWLAPALAGCCCGSCAHKCCQGCCGLGVGHKLIARWEVLEVTNCSTLRRESSMHQSIERRCLAQHHTSVFAAARFWAARRMRLFG